MGSPVAFLNLAGSFIILTTTSYAIPFAANVASGRKYFPPGPFHLGKLGLPINILAVLFITLFNVFYCFRKAASVNFTLILTASIAYALPITVETMNYNAVILMGVVAITGIWWVAHAIRHYPGPKVMTLYIHDDALAVGLNPVESTEVAMDRKAQ